MPPTPVDADAAAAEAPSAAGVLRVGLTGNIGAGKTVVGRVLAEGDCLVLDADRLAREVLEPDMPAHREVLEAFGAEILAPDGSIERQALAGVAFADDRSRERLEEITHPRIRELERHRVREWAARRDGGGIAVTEAALLVETGGAARYHRLVVVTAPEPVRRRRLLERGGDPGDIDRRMRAQLPQARKVAAADYVIDNGGDLETTRAAAEGLLDRLREDHRALIAGHPLPARSPEPGR